jgi:hypothetical protein
MAHLMGPIKGESESVGQWAYSDRKMLIDPAKYYDAADRFSATFQAFVGIALDDYHCERESLLTTSGRAGMRASLWAAGKKAGTVSECHNTTRPAGPTVAAFAYETPTMNRTATSCRGHPFET